MPPFALGLSLDTNRGSVLTASGPTPWLATQRAAWAAVKRTL
jgi:hypothetical protein